MTLPAGVKFGRHVKKENGGNGGRWGKGWAAFSPGPRKRGHRKAWWGCMRLSHPTQTFSPSPFFPLTLTCPFMSCVQWPFRIPFVAHFSSVYTGGLGRGTSMDYEVQRSTRRCSTTGREFAPGETYYSVLVAEGAELKRYDYAADAWQGPPEEAVGWWKSQVPDRNAARKHWAPNDVMLDFWDELADQPDKQDMRYVLTLLLIRRRVFRLEEEKCDAAGAGAVGGVLSAPRGHVSGSRRRARAAADRSDSGGVGGAAAVDGK